MTKTPLLAAALLALTATGAHAQMSQPNGLMSPMPQLPATQGMQTPYIEVPTPAAPSVQSAPAYSGTISTAQPTLPAPVQPQIQGYTAPGTTGTLGTPGMAIGAPVGMTTN
jgi:hypothetical protein